MSAHAQRVPRHATGHARFVRLTRGITLAVLALVVFASSAAAIAYSSIQGNIKTHDIGDYLGERPSAEGEPPEPLDPAAGVAINVLVLGSDSREGEVNDEYGTTPEGSMRSDTAMIAHISADRSRVEVVSIPRDTLVTIPACRLEDGTWTEPRTNSMFNGAFTTGAQDDDLGAAAACTIRTVEELTGVYIDDFVVVDFAGFIDVVDALGGVPMCVPEDIDDRRAHASISAGQQVLDGRDALAFARARYTIGDGSDISRIGRQQDLVAAIAREALSMNLFTDLPELYRFLNAATSTLTTGSQLGSISTLAGLAYSIRDIDVEDISFTTMPFDWEGDRVRPSTEADELWEALRTDEPIEATLTATGEAPTEHATDAPSADGDQPSTAPTPDEGTEPEPTPTPTPSRTSICP